jgi:hypothetical protein
MLDYVSLVLGAGIGFLSSAGLFFVQERWKRRNEKNNAIALLRTEISLLLQVIDDGIIPSLNESLKLTEEPSAICRDIPMPKLDTQFYEKCTNSISLIKTETLSRIKDFYFAINLYEHAIEKASLYRSDKALLKSWLKKALDALLEAKRFGEALLLEF